MKKIGKIIPILVCSFLVAGGGLAALQGLKAMEQPMKQAKADTTNLILNLGRTNNSTGIYMNADENELPFNDDWNTRYFPTQASCIKVNGVDSANRLYPGNTSTGMSLIKYDAKKYYFDIGKLPPQVGDVLTFGGVWGSDSIGYTFTLDEFSIKWNGEIWMSDVADSELEAYDIITLRDAGILELDQEVISTEDSGAAWATWIPSEGNTHYNFEFSFILQTYTNNPDEFCIRIGSSASWVTGHYIQVNVYATTITLNEFEGGTQLWGHGDIAHDFDHSTTKITIGNIRTKTGNKEVTYMLLNDEVKAFDLHYIPGELGLQGHFGFYHNAADCSIRNAWAEDYYALNGQVVSEDVDTAGGGAPNGLYFSVPANNIPVNGWSNELQPVDKMNLLINGQPFYGYKKNAFVKFDNTRYYLKLSDWGYNSLISEGSVVVMRGHFRNFINGVMYDLYIAPTAFKLVNEKWKLCEFEALAASSADQLQPTDLLTNIGRTNPSNRSKTSVKEFDQKVIWDDENNCEIDTLVYKKDRNGHTGVYFTSSDESTHGEFRVYFPDNGYKTESKGYAMTQLTFDYMYDNAGTITAQGRNHSLTEDGYFIPASGAVTNNFTIQAMLAHNSKNMYYDFEVELINDGNLHSVTLNLAYGDVYGFCFVLWNFKGTFFMSNVHADYQEYNANLSNMYGLLQMYNNYDDASIGEDKCGDYYAAAKAGYLALTADEKALFNTHASYASARGRLTAWAIANGETFDVANGTFTPNGAGSAFNLKNGNNAILIIIASSVLAAASLLGVLLVLKKRKYSK